MYWYVNTYLKIFIALGKNDAYYLTNVRYTGFEMDIASIRTKLKMSQQEFSEFVGISKYTIRSYEQGHRKPSMKTCNQIIECVKKKGIKIAFKDIRPDIFD